MKVRDQAGIELGTPGSAVRLASVARHITDCTTQPGKNIIIIIIINRLFIEEEKPKVRQDCTSVQPWLFIDATT